MMSSTHHCSETSKDKHVDEIGGTTTERAFLKHSTVAVCEYHIKQEVETECPKEAEWSHQSP